MNKADASRIREEFEKGTSFLSSLNLFNDIERCNNFLVGNQWSNNIDLRDYPKIVINVIRQIRDVQLSQILQNEYSFLVSSNNYKSNKKIQDFLKFISSKLKLRKLDLEAIEDTATKGTALMYFFWDGDKYNYATKTKGELRAEIVDIRNFRVANEYNANIQDQEWVIFSNVEKKVALSKKYGIKEIKGDLENYDKRQYVDGDERVNVYTKFYRNEDGQVHFIISTSDMILKEATPLNPFYKGSKKAQEDTLKTPDTYEMNRIKERTFNLYPFACLVLNRRDKCFYGIPSITEMIEAQKSINSHFALYEKALENNVIGGFIKKSGVMQDIEITTDNAQIWNVDLGPNERVGDVITRIPPANIPQDSLNYSNNLLGLIKSVNGASNVLIGQSDYSGQSGRQTAMLINRAKENSTSKAMLFNEFKKEQAEIMFLFSIFYYENVEFTLTKHGQEMDINTEYKGENSYNGEEYIEEDLMIDIKVSPSQTFSESASLEIAGLMVQSGQIDYKMYLKQLPDGYVNNRDELLKDIEEMEARKAEKEQLINQVQSLQKELEDSRKSVEESVEIMGKAYAVLEQNKKLKEMVIELTNAQNELMRGFNKGESFYKNRYEEQNEILEDTSNALFNAIGEQDDIIQGLNEINAVESKK